METRMDGLATKEEVKEAVREGYEELSAGHHNHEARITRLEREDHHGFQIRAA